MPNQYYGRQLLNEVPGAKKSEKMLWQKKTKWRDDGLWEPFYLPYSQKISRKKVKTK